VSQQKSMGRSDGDKKPPSTNGARSLHKEQPTGFFAIAWWLIRGRTLVLAAAAALLGGAMAWRVDFFQTQLWLACLAGLLLAQATANLIHWKLDSAEETRHLSVWGTSVEGDDALSQAPYVRSLVVLSALALSCGAWIVSVRGGATFDLMLAGVALIVFFCWPLRRYGLGEITALLVWGPLTVHGTFYVVAGGWSPELVPVAFLFAIGPAATLLAEHVDRHNRDAAQGIRTLPVMFGIPAACTLLKLSVALQYALLCTLFYNETFGWPVLLVLLCATRVPLLWNFLDYPAASRVPAATVEESLPLGLVEPVFVHARFFNAAFVLAVMLDVLIVDVLT